MVRVRDLIDTAMEASVVPSFSRAGHAVRRRLFEWQPLPRADSRVCVVTGANSGLGYATAALLARQGAVVVAVCRDPDRGAAAVGRLQHETGNERIELALADMSSHDAVRALAAELARRHDRVDVLVHNAGALVHERQVTPDGLEVTLATHVVGPWLLTALLLPMLEASDDGRVVTVSSGGMYSVALSLDDLQSEQGEFDGTRVYARAKRAQVALGGEWARRLAPLGITVATMHPGWAETPGVAASLPTFDRLTRPILRSPAEGADTIAWLALAPEVRDRTGAFWHDRAPRPVHKLGRTKKGDHLAGRLFAEVRSLAGWTDPLPGDGPSAVA